MSAAKSVGRKASTAGDVNVEETALTNELTESEAGIVRRFDRLIGYMARKFHLESDDLIQVGRIELVRAHRMWLSKREHSSNFWTYARKAVLGGMIDFVARETSRRGMEFEWRGEHDETAQQSDAPPAFCAQDLALEAREHLSSLPPRESSVLTMYIAGHDIAEIASTNDISRSRVYQLIEDSIENIRERA